MTVLLLNVVAYPKLHVPDMMPGWNVLVAVKLVMQKGNAGQPNGFDIVGCGGAGGGICNWFGDRQIPKTSNLSKSVWKQLSWNSHISVNSKNSKWSLPGENSLLNTKDLWFEVHLGFQQPHSPRYSHLGHL